MNRAVNGDIVVVEVFNEKEWRAPGDEVVDQNSELYLSLISFLSSAFSVTLKDDDVERSGEEGESDNDEVIARETRHIKSEHARASAEKQPTGRVVGIIKRNWRAYVCHIESDSLTSQNATSLAQQTVFAIPVSRSLPRIRLKTRQAPILIGQKIVVTIDRWDVNSRYPEGHFVRALGKVESKEAEQESLLLEFDVPYRPFGKAILDCLPSEGEQWAVPPKSDDTSHIWKDREDLRQLQVCSIDPPGTVSLPGRTIRSLILSLWFRMSGH